MERALSTGVEFTKEERARLPADFTRLKDRILPLSEQARAAGSIRPRRFERPPAHQRRTSAERSVLSFWILPGLIWTSAPNSRRMSGPIGRRRSVSSSKGAGRGSKRFWSHLRKWEFICWTCRPATLRSLTERMIWRLMRNSRPSPRVVTDCLVTDCPC